MPDQPSIPSAVLNGFGAFEGLSEADALSKLTPITDGLINATWKFQAEPALILQRLHPIFGAAVNEDIAALVPHLRAGGVPVPDVVPTKDGALSLSVPAKSLADAPSVWRMLTALGGRTIHHLSNLPQAKAGGAAVGRFHRALQHVDHTFAFTRPGAHDTDAHMAFARGTSAAQSMHPLTRSVVPLVADIVAAWERCKGRAPAEDLPLRIVHGDLKVSNLLYGSDDTVVGVIDLDTMAHGTLDIELGDMLRSWCNQATEDATGVVLDRDIFAAAMSGYFEVAGSMLTVAEARSVVAGLERICLELSARFAADALNESYFGWSAAVAPTRGEHNLLRARNQYSLACSVAAQRDELEAVCSRLYEQSAS